MLLGGSVGFGRSSAAFIPLRGGIALPGGSRVEFASLDSQALRGQGQYSIFFPPSYDSNKDVYPVLYFLHGLFNDHTSWTDSEHGNLPAKIERLMLEKKIPEMLLVHPNGGRSFYTNYYDGHLKYEDFVVKELVGHVETTYRARKGRRNRSIAGTSMGGFGALKIAMKYPDMYGAVAAHSPIVFLNRNPLDVSPEMKSSRRFRFFKEVFTTVYGDPLNQEYYDSNNPLVLAKSADLDGLPIYFDYGTADRYNRIIQLGRGLEALDQALTQSGSTARIQNTSWRAARVGPRHGTCRGITRLRVPILLRARCVPPPTRRSKATNG